jgi:hypothetical protein
VGSWIQRRIAWVAIPLLMLRLRWYQGFKELQKQNQKEEDEAMFT